MKGVWTTPYPLSTLLSQNTDMWICICICNNVERVYCKISFFRQSWMLAAWYSGRSRTPVFDRRTFPVPRSTCGWWVITYVGKQSVGNNPVGISSRSFASKKLSFWAIGRCCVRDPTFISRFATTLTCDGQTDGQTRDDSK